MYHKAQCHASDHEASAKEKQPGGKGRDLNECWFTPAFPCPSAAERKKSVEAQRRTTSHGRETSSGRRACSRTGSSPRPRRARRSRIIATWISDSLVCTFRSSSLLNLLLRESHPY